MQTAEPSSHSMCRDVGVDCTVEGRGIHQGFRRPTVSCSSSCLTGKNERAVPCDSPTHQVSDSQKPQILHARRGACLCAARCNILFCKRKASYDKQRKCVKGGRYWQSAEQSFLPQTVPNPASSSANEGQRAGCCALLVTKQLLGYCRSTPNLDLLATQFPEPSFFPSRGFPYSSTCK